MTGSFHFDLKQAKETILAHSAILQEKEEEIQRLQKEVSHMMQLHHNSMHIDWVSSSKVISDVFFHQLQSRESELEELREEVKPFRNSPGKPTYRWELDQKAFQPLPFYSLYVILNARDNDMWWMGDILHNSLRVAWNCLLFYPTQSFFLITHSALHEEIILARQERDALNQQLLNTIRHKVALSQEVETWQVGNL